MTEYAEKFKHLCRFYTMPLDEEWRCRKFENDLRRDLRLMVVPLSIKDFAGGEGKGHREDEGRGGNSVSIPAESGRTIWVQT